MFPATRLRRLRRTDGLRGPPVTSYSTKFASGFYGPFRDAAGCDLDGDRKSYQTDPANGREGIRESLDDAAEGAEPTSPDAPPT